jgi:uncharacterized protein
VRHRVRGMLHLVLRVEDTPGRVALSFAIGVFIAFSPVLGIHTGLALGLAFAFRLNRVAILTGAWINNPWTIAPMYLAGTLLGCALLGVPSAGLESINWNLHGRAFYAALLEGLRPYLLPYLVGNTLLGLVFGALAYLLVRSVLERRASGVAPAG